MAYTAFDRAVARLRFRAALPHIRSSTRVVDIGCGHNADFLEYADSRIRFGVGVDYQVCSSARTSRAMVRCDITQSLPLRSEQFDHAVMLAVLEHLIDPEPLFKEVFRILLPGASYVMTWPEPAVDPLLHFLHRAGWVSKEMESDKHQARIPLPRLLLMLTEAGFTRFHHQKFEFRLNNLLVAYKDR